MGFSLGGTVAMHAGTLWATDPAVRGRTRINLRGVSCLACVHPLRNESLAASTGGNRRLYGLHALVPRLGWFRVSGGRLPLHQWPYDYDDLIAAMAGAGTRVQVYAPLRDRLANLHALKRVLVRARGRVPPSTLNVTAVDEIPIVNDRTQASVLNWLSEIMA